MKKIIVLMLFASLLTVGCGKLTMPDSGDGRTIKVKVTGVETKVSPTTTSTLSSFNLSAYATAAYREIQRNPSNPEYSAGIYTDPSSGSKLQDISVSGSNSTGWAINGSFSWINGIAMRFFAYSPATTATKGTLSIEKSDLSYDTAYPFEYSALANTSDEVTSTSCDDIIFAYAQNTATFEDDPTDSDYGELINGTKDYIDLTFHHALAQIRFCVDPAEWGELKLIYVKLYGPKSTSDPTKYVGIASEGSCTFDTTQSDMFSWNLGSSPARYAYSQTFNGTTGITFSSGVPTGWTSSTYGTSPDLKTLYTCTSDALLVIPQSLSECAVEVCLQDGTATPMVMKALLPPTESTGPVYWKFGKYYTYKIGTTGSRDELGLSMTLVDWDERENYIPIG